MSYLSTLWTWLRGEIAILVSVLKPALSAYAKNLAKVGITDIAGFIKAAEPIALAAGSAAIMSGGSGTAVLIAVAQALAPVAVKFGGDVTHDAMSSVLKTTAELLHQPEVAARVEAQ